MYLAFKSAALAGGWFSRAIAWKTKGPYSHVELWMTGPRENATCFSSREPDGTGYAHINLSAPLYAVVEIPATPDQMEAVRWFAEGTGKKRYDFLGILGFVVTAREHDPAAVFCSEWCTLVLQRCLGLFPGVKPWMTSPSQLYKMAID